MQSTASYEPCKIDHPDDFYVVQRLRSDKEVIDYLNNCLGRYDWWVNTKGWPNCRGAKTMAWRCEVLKRILVERDLVVPDLYDTVFGYEPPVKKRLLKNGLQEEVRFAQQQLKDQKARAFVPASSLLHKDANDAIPDAKPEEEEDTEPIEEPSLKGFLGLVSRSTAVPKGVVPPSDDSNSDGL